jgi:hypothetical protein
MKNQKKITRVQLKEEGNYIYILLGLVVTEPDYRLSLEINNKAGLSLKSDKPVEFKDENENLIKFSRYSDLRNPQEKTFILVSNKSDKNILIRKYKNIDYFLLVQSHELTGKPDMLIGNLRKIDKITGIFNISTDDIKDKYLNYLTF